MMLKNLEKINYAIAAVVIVLGIIAVSAVMKSDKSAPQSTREITETYNDWIIECFQNDSNRNGSNICVGAFKKDDKQASNNSKQISAELKMITRAGKPIPRLKVIAPLGIFLPAGISLTLPSQEPFIVPVQFCTLQGCFINLDLADDVVQALINSDALGVGYMLSNRETTQTQISLDGFENALTHLQK